MALSPGSRIGHYDVTSLLGEGGMGQVWQATDTQLGREVALKILPDAFADDSDRLARFTREAQILASLNHPNIAAIHGIEEAEGTRALVLELVEGPTLADRISKGPIPVDEALPIAKQIAEALEAAHEAGVIHRDLKPANIKVRDDGTVKVLDFGVAKTFQIEAPEPNAARPAANELTVAATQMGMVIGTAAYMSPEQAKGSSVGKSADVWAFGVVFYEMVTGANPFAAESVSTTLARVIEREADWDVLPHSLSPILVTFLRRCLAKEPKQRVHDVVDVRLAIEGAFDVPASPPIGLPDPSAEVPRRQGVPRPRAVALAGLALLVVGGFVLMATVGREPTVAPDLIRFAIAPLDSAPFATGRTRPHLVISGDGTWVVYVGLTADGLRLHRRSFHQLDGVPLNGGGEGIGPFASPNGEWVGFVRWRSTTTLRKVPILGGTSQMVTESPGNILGASWESDDQIIFGTDDAGLFGVSADGGEAEALTTLDTGHGEVSHTWPFIIPGQKAVVFVVNTAPASDTHQLAVLNLDTGEVTRLGLAGSSPHYVPTGHLVYATQAGFLYAVSFDPASQEVTGSPVRLVEGVAVTASGAAEFSVSDNGHLVYGLASAAEFRQSLVRLDSNGQQEPTGLPQDDYINARLSPDGTQVSLRGGGNALDLWVSDVERNTLSRLTTDPASDYMGMWSLDAERIIFSSNREGGRGLFSRSADGTGEIEPLVTIAEAQSLVLWGRPVDSERLVFSYQGSSGSDIVLFSLNGQRSLQPVLNSAANERFASVSPDGRWLAYESDETGDWEVYVQRFPDGGNASGSHLPEATSLFGLLAVMRCSM